LLFAIIVVDNAASRQRREKEVTMVMKHVSPIWIAPLLILALISTALAGVLSGVNVSNTTADSSAPVLAPDGTNTLHIVWEESDSLYTNRKATTGNWLSVPVQISTGNAPSLARGSDGSLHLAWSDYSALGRNYEIYYSKWLGSAWDVPLNVSNTDANSSSPDVAVKPDGTAYVTWFDPSTIYYGVIDKTGVVSSTGIVTLGAGVQNPAIAVSADGNVHLVWQEPDDDTGNYEVFYTYNDGSGWNPVTENVSRSPDINSTAPDVAVTTNGVVYAIWTQGIHPNTSILYAARKGASWTTPVTVSQGTAFSPFIAADTAGFVHALWVEQDASGYRLVYGWGKDGMLVRSEVLVDSALPITEGALYPQISGNTFTVHVAWSAQTANGGPYDIFYGAHQWTLNSIYLPLVLSSG